MHSYRYDGAESATHPIDFVKTLRQVSHKSSSALHVAKLTFARHSIGGFYPAIVPAVLRHWVYGTIKLDYMNGCVQKMTEFKPNLLLHTSQEVLLRW